jgi:hypothetical protein
MLPSNTVPHRLELTKFQVLRLLCQTLLSNPSSNKNLGLSQYFSNRKNGGLHKNSNTMKKHKLPGILAATLLYFSAFSILMVSFMAFANPQEVMNLVQVSLPNNDAYSSIRGVYGGVGLAIAAVIIYCAIKDRSKGLVFIALLWGAYALSRLVTMAVEGPLGAFGTQWLYTESTLCLCALLLLPFLRKAQTAKAANKK